MATKTVKQCTKAELVNVINEQSAKLEAYRDSERQLYAKLEEQGTPHNVCDTVVEFFDDCAAYISGAALSAWSLVPDVPRIKVTVD